MATFASLIVVGLLSFNQAPVWLAILVALACPLSSDWLNGLLVAYAKLNSLVVTLAAGSLLFGASEIYSGGATIYQNVPKAFLAVGQSRIAGIPLPFVYVIIVALIAWYILEYRPIGRYMYAIGGGEEGARLVGIKVDRLVVLVFVASSFMAGLGGVVQSVTRRLREPERPAVDAPARLHRGLSRRDFDPAGAVQHLGHRDRRLSGGARHDRPLHARRLILHRAGLRRRSASRRDRARQAQRARSVALVKSTQEVTPMNPADKVAIGKTKLKVTRLGLGTGLLGALHEDDPWSEIIKTAWSAGVRSFDTSPYYGFGTSEIRLGRALARYDRRRLRHLDQGRQAAAEPTRLKIPSPKRFTFPREGRRARCAASMTIARRRRASRW